MRVSKEQREALLRAIDDMERAIAEAQGCCDHRKRAERAEAELATLRERVRGMADNADRWAEASLSRDINGRTFGATVTTDDLRCLLDDDTTGAASGEGEK